MKQINQKHIDALIPFINQAPYFKLLAMEIVELRSGYCRMEINLNKNHLNPMGGIHGGAFASIIDTATFWAFYCDLAEDAGLTTIDLKIDYLSTVNIGNLVVAEGKIIKAGRMICLSEATVKDNSGKLLTHGTSKLMVLQGVQITSQIESATGQTLPPKFKIS